MSFGVERWLGIVALVRESKAERSLEAPLVSQDGTPHAIRVTRMRLAELSPRAKQRGTGQDSDRNAGKRAAHQHGRGQRRRWRGGSAS